MTLSELHRDHGRAESFGSAAEDYDRYRPTFPDALIDDLAALGGTDALDVGCGTGRVARLLAQRGLSVLGVELDPRMAAVARGHGVEVAPFEEWDDAGRRFDLVACGDAWPLDRSEARRCEGGARPPARGSFGPLLEPPAWCGWND